SWPGRSCASCCGLRCRACPPSGAAKGSSSGTTAAGKQPTCGPRSTEDPHERLQSRLQPDRDRAPFDAGCVIARAASTLLLRAAFAALVLALAACRGTLVHEVQSPYSHIQVYDSGGQRLTRHTEFYDWGGQRAIYFGGDEGGRVVETLMDLREPHVLQHAYTRAAMAAFLYRPQAGSCLLIGLGGGSMVRLINRHFTRVTLRVAQ